MEISKCLSALALNKLKVNLDIGWLILNNSSLDDKQVSHKQNSDGNLFHSLHLTGKNI